MIRIAAVTVLLLASAAQAEDRAPQTLMASLIQLLAVSEHCGLPIAPDDRVRLGDAGRRLQDKLGLTDEAVEEIGEEIMQDAEDVDCTSLDRTTFTTTLRATLDEAERVR